jgi:hypothetical protein
MVGLDVYPRHALVGTARSGIYLDGSHAPWGRGAATSGHGL